MCSLQDIIGLLSVDDDIGTDPLQIISQSLKAQKDALENCGLRGELTAEGLKVDLSEQDFYIYKNKADALKYIDKSTFQSKIIILQDKLFFTPGSFEFPFFENLFYWFEFKELFVNFSIVDHEDTANRVLIFLSDKLGKVNVGYKNKEVENFPEIDIDVSKTFKVLKQKLESSVEYLSFFKNAFMRGVMDCRSEGSRYTYALINIEHIVENSNRDFELFKNNFSFEEFQQDLHKEKEKYFKDYQENLTDFLSKVASMPLQFGAYIILLFKFEKDMWPLIATIVLIIVWGWYKRKTVTQIIDNVIYLKVKAGEMFDQIIDKSKLPSEEIKREKDEVLERFRKSVSMFRTYRCIITVFSILCLLISWHFLIQIRSL